MGGLDPQRPADLCAGRGRRPASVLGGNLRLLTANCGKGRPATLEEYQAGGGYAGLRQALKISPTAVIAEVKNAGLVGPVARAAGVDIDCRRDHPYAAYDRVDFDVITEAGCDVWSRVVVRMREVFEAIRIIRQCLEKMEEGPLQAPIKD